MRTKLFLLYLIFLFIALALHVPVKSATPTDRGIDAAYGVITSYDYNTDTIKGATDSAVLKTNFIISGQQKGCLFEIVIPKIIGTGNDSVRGVIGIKGYTKEGTFLYKYITSDTLRDSIAYRFILPIETPIAPADKYDIIIYGYTGSGGQVIFPAGKIYALKPFVRAN